jgi:uncharacterized protein YoxC
MAGLTIKTIFQAVNKMTQPITTMQAQVGKFSSAANRATAGMSAGFGRLRGVIAGALGGLTVVGAVRGIAAFAERGDEIARTARMLGLSAEGLQELNFAAKMADMTAEDLALAFRKMNNNLGELKGGSGALYTHLKKSNPQLARQLRTVKDSDEAFTMLMAAIAGETDVQKRASLAQAAFGKSGQALIAMTKDLAEKRREAHAQGAVQSKADIDAAEAMDGSLKRLKASGIGLLNNVLGRIAQSLAPILEKWAAWITANKEMLALKINEVIDKIVRAVKDVYEIVKKVNDFMGGKLARNIALSIIAWKSLAAAITLAELAQIAFKIASGGGAAKAVAGAAAGTAAKAVAGTAAGAGVGTVLAAATIPAAAVVGIAALGQQYAKWQNSMITDPNQIAGGQKALMSTKQLAAYEALVAREGPPARVMIDFTGMPLGVVVRQSSAGTGAPAVTLNRGTSLGVAGGR